MGLGVGFCVLLIDIAGEALVGATVVGLVVDLSVVMVVGTVVVGVVMGMGLSVVTFSVTSTGFLRFLGFCVVSVVKEFLDSPLFLVFSQAGRSGTFTVLELRQA